MEPNVPLLRKVVEWVETESKTHWTKRAWRQGSYFLRRKALYVEKQRQLGWDCGTAMCVAGKVAFDDGWDPVFSQPAVEYEQGANEAQKRIGDRVVQKDVRHIAADLLGLNEVQAVTLFAGNNRARDIRRIAEKIAGERL